MILVYLVIAGVGYLIGAIPIGVLVADYKKVDIRGQGSGKTGATNVLRTMGRRAAGLVLLGDFLKGAIAVYVAGLIAGAFFTPGERVGWLDDRMSVLTLANYIGAIAAIAGHVWSIYVRILTGKWSGGRGVATALGGMFMVYPGIMLLALGVGIVTIIVSRYVSLGSILGAVASAIAVIVLVLFGYMNALSLLFVTLGLFVIASHRDNIERLLKGTERKLGEHATKV